MDSAVPAGHTVKINENEKRNKLLDFLRKLIKQQRMRVTVILIVTGALGLVPKGLEKALEELEIWKRIETI